MTHPQLLRLRDHLGSLKLFTAQERLESLLRDASAQEVPDADCLARLFFQLIARRYERGAILLTANQSFGQWAEVFGDPIVATAILDRLVHRSHVINNR